MMPPTRPSSVGEGDEKNRVPAAGGASRFFSLNFFLSVLTVFSLLLVSMAMTPVFFLGEQAYASSSCGTGPPAVNAPPSPPVRGSNDNNDAYQSELDSYQSSLDSFQSFLDQKQKYLDCLWKSNTLTDSEQSVLDATQSTQDSFQNSQDSTQNAEDSRQHAMDSTWAADKFTVNAVGVPAASPSPSHSSGYFSGQVSGFDLIVEPVDKYPNDVTLRDPLLLLPQLPPNLGGAALFTSTFSSPGGVPGSKWTLADLSDTKHLTKTVTCQPIPHVVSQNPDGAHVFSITLPTGQVLSVPIANSSIGQTFVTRSPAGTTSEPSLDRIQDLHVDNFVTDITGIGLSAESLRLSFVQNNPHGTSMTGDPAFNCGLTNFAFPPNQANPLYPGLFIKPPNPGLMAIFGTIAQMQAVNVSGPALPWGKEFLIYAQLRQFKLGDDPKTAVPLNVYTYEASTLR